MLTDEAFLRRFLIARCSLPRDLAAWATAKLLDALPPARRIAERDRLLRAAAAHLAAAPRWTKARQIRAEAAAARRALPAEPDLRTLRGCVAAAMLVYPGKILSVRQLHRVLSVADTSPLEMSERPVERSEHELATRAFRSTAGDTRRRRPALDPR
jgi:hypothetical protein